MGNHSILGTSPPPPGNALQHHHPTWKVDITHVSLTIGECLREHIDAFAQVAL